MGATGADVLVGCCSAGPAMRCSNGSSLSTGFKMARRSYESSATYPLESGWLRWPRALIASTEEEQRPDGEPRGGSSADVAFHVEQNRTCNLNGGDHRSVLRETDTELVYLMPARRWALRLRMLGAEHPCWRTSVRALRLRFASEVYRGVRSRVILIRMAAFAGGQPDARTHARGARVFSITHRPAIASLPRPWSRGRPPTCTACVDGRLAGRFHVEHSRAWSARAPLRCAGHPMSADAEEQSDQVGRAGRIGGSASFHTYDPVGRLPVPGALAPIWTTMRDRPPHAPPPGLQT
jgi:hypothetical protein